MFHLGQGDRNYGTDRIKGETYRVWGWCDHRLGILLAGFKASSDDCGVFFRLISHIEYKVLGVCSIQSNPHTTVATGSDR